MVRLKPLTLFGITWQINTFQSHNGSIKTNGGEKSIITLKNFNPTMVRLKHLYLSMNWQQYLYFNPTMDRLKLYHTPDINYSKMNFNPTMVRLKHKEQGFCLEARNSFQSHNGSIKTSSSSVLFTILSIISIPQWFD